MKLRIITAAFGESPFWRETVASVLTAAPEAEHVVVCPLQRMADIGSAGEKFSMVPEVASGLFPKLNQGLRTGGGFDVYTWINDDDVLRAPGFGALLAMMERDPSIDVAFGRVDLIDVRSARICALPIVRNGKDLAALFARGIIPLAQPGTVMRRELCERLGGFDETYRLAGDVDLIVRAILAGARFKFVDAHVASFRLRRGQLSKRKAEVAVEKNRALQPLAGIARSTGAVTRFRLANLPAYAERIRRHGWVSLRDLYDRTE